MTMSHNSSVIFVLEVGATVKGLHQHLDGTDDTYTLHCRRVVLGYFPYRWGCCMLISSLI